MIKKCDVFIQRWFYKYYKYGLNPRLLLLIHAAMVVILGIQY